MIYSEKTLQSWTAPMSETEKKRMENTVLIIKSAMDAGKEMQRRNLDYEVFAQGSYANDTNIRPGSAVDVCVMLKSTYYYELPEGKLASADDEVVPKTTTFQEFRDFVMKALQDRFGAKNVADGNKSLKVRDNTTHVRANVVPAFQFRCYLNVSKNIFLEGIRFHAKDRSLVTNFPKLHLVNAAAKDKRTNQKYKALVRIMKHIRDDMVEKKLVDGDIITSFLAECLIWNVPDDIITRYPTWTETLWNTIVYLHNTVSDGKQDEWTEGCVVQDLFDGSKWTADDVRQWLFDTWKYTDLAHHPDVRFSD